MARISRRRMLQASAATTLAGCLSGLGVADRASAGPAWPIDENGYELWLRYRTVSPPALRARYRRSLRHVVTHGSDPLVSSARDELLRGLTGLLDHDIPSADRTEAGALVIGTRSDSPIVADTFTAAELEALGPDGYAIRTSGPGAAAITVIGSVGAPGILYGAFALLRLLQTHQAIDDLTIAERPAYPLRMLNHWDNLDGSIERGYAGKSIFWANGRLRDDPVRHNDYGRALASVGINAAAVSNVNANLPANARLLDPAHDADFAALAGRLRRFGIRMFLTPSFDSPMTVGGLTSADPLDPAVRTWWARTTDRLYTAIPDLGGFLIKADSEGQPGPGTYGRNHDDGANMLAAPLADHGGVVVWRAFVYGAADTDRAKQAYQAFAPLDGRFSDNVIVQVKNGPIDFQVREPVSPLLGAMPRTNLTCELEITQEYTGQSTDLCHLLPQWKTVLDTPVDDRGTSLADLLRRRAAGGLVGVSNFGDDLNWTGHHLAAANAYGFGRLAWNPSADPGDITREWTQSTFGADETTVDTISGLLLESGRTYEQYTSPLGIGLMCDGATHFNPAPAARTAYSHADAHGLGYDRTAATGSGFTGQYPPGIAAGFEQIDRIPDELLLFFHHVAYTHRLNSGKTVIQHIYDTHIDGAARARMFADAWSGLAGRIDHQRLHETAVRFEAQIAHAAVWRDSIVGYFRTLSGIADESGRW